MLKFKQAVVAAALIMLAALGIAAHAQEAPASKNQWAPVETRRAGDQPAPKAGRAPAAKPVAQPEAQARDVQTQQTAPAAQAAPAAPSSAPAATPNAQQNTAPEQAAPETAPAQATPEAGPPPTESVAEPAAPPPPPPQKVLPPEVNDTINSVVGVMEGAEKSLKEISGVNTDLSRLRDEIDGVISKSTQTADSLRPRLSDIQTQIDKLGPAPEKDATPEAPSVSAERTRLNSEAAEVSGAIKTLEVTWFRARQAIDKITELRLHLFVRNLTERMSSPLFPELWTNLQKGVPSVSWRLQYNLNDWLSSIARQKFNVLLLVSAVFGLYMLLKGIAYRITRYRARPDGSMPTFFQRAASASWIAPVRAVPGVVSAIALYAGLDYLGLLYYPTMAPVGAALLRAALVFILVAALLTAVFAPSYPERRLVSLSNRSARRICRLLKLLAFIYAADLFLSEFGQILYFPLSISVVQSLITSLAFAAVLIGLALTSFEPHEVSELQAVSRSKPRWIKIPLWIAAGAIVLVCLMGYVALGRFLAQQIVMTGVVGLVATLLYLAIRAFTRGEESIRGGSVGTFLEHQMGVDASRRQQLSWLTESVLTLGVVMLVAPVLLLQWGFAGADIRDWAKSLLFGFEIGQFRISLVRILIGVLLFMAILFATRLIQGRLRENVLIQPKMDPGIANSIYTAVGYAGTALAAMLAISYAGFDITNLAIVAGALSVGIGFGLQSIVNNFVSGLILLIERPIKVGDWVVVGNEQGTVRRISVRSTEIETFDRASLIVPNSELITGRVLNWTHRNSLGRAVIKFSTDADADPRRVVSVLVECASRHPDVLREPPPLAVFEGNTSTQADFSVSVLLPDVSKRTKVASDIRIAIVEALRNSNVAPIRPVTIQSQSST